MDIFNTWRIHLGLITSISIKQQSFLQKIYETYHREVIKYAKQVVAEEAAKDVVSTVFLRLWLKMQKGEKIANFKPYLYMATRNGCLDHLRRSRRIAVVLENPCVISTATLLERDYKARELLMKELDRLPPKIQKVVKLFYLGELQEKEISQLHATSIYTVKAQKQAGMTALRSRLAKAGFQ